jgi:hypothetical protein
MKKRILLLSFVLVGFIGMSFAADEPYISKNVIQAFNQKFSSANETQWENHKTYMRAQFKMNNMVLFAYFNNNGELLAVTRFISPDQLPLALQGTLKTKNEGYWVSDLFEIQTENGTAYYATLENSDQVVILKSEGTGGWGLLHKEKKSVTE